MAFVTPETCSVDVIASSKIVVVRADVGVINRRYCASLLGGDQTPFFSFCATLQILLSFGAD